MFNTDCDGKRKVREPSHTTLEEIPLNVQATDRLYSGGQLVQDGPIMLAGLLATECPIIDTEARGVEGKANK